MYQYLGFHVKYLLLLLDFNETWIFCTDFRDTRIDKISWNFFLWEPDCPCGRPDRQKEGRTDRHDEANSRLLQFCERANQLFFVLVIATTVKQNENITQVWGFRSGVHWDPDLQRHDASAILASLLFFILIAEVVSCGRRTDRRTDMTRLTVAFRNFANVPKSIISISSTRLRLTRRAPAVFNSRSALCTELSCFP